MPSTSSMASCLPGTRSDSCPRAKAGAPCCRPRAQAGPPAAPEGQKAPSYSKCRVYSWKGSVLLFPTAVPHAAEDLRAHCTAIHDRTLLLSPLELGGSAGTQTWCRRPTCPLAMSPVPRPTLLSPFHPRLPGVIAGKGGGCWCFWRAVAQLAAAQPAGCIPVCWWALAALVRAPCSPRLALGRCHPLPCSSPG